MIADKFTHKVINITSLLFGLCVILIIFEAWNNYKKAQQPPNVVVEKCPNKEVVKTQNMYEIWLTGCYECGLGIRSEKYCKIDFPEIKWNSSKNMTKNQCR